MVPSRLEELFKRYYNKTASEEERAELMQWINESKDNEDLAKLVQQSGNSLDSFEDILTSQKAEAMVQSILDRTRVETPVRKIGWRSYAAAACIIFALIGAWKWWLVGRNNQQDIVYQQQLVTQNGSRSELVLPDGSKVWLNAGSTLDYPKRFDGKTRDVQLQGEAYFEVAKDREKPFFVHTKAFKIKVLGTGFNVRAYPDEDSAVAALVHGSVEVIVGEKEKRSILLRPNEKLTLPMIGEKGDGAQNLNDQQAVSALLPVKGKMTLVQDTVQLETAWVSNKLAFKKMPLGNIALLLEKWYGEEIRFKNDDKRNLVFSGVYQKEEDLEEVLYSLELASGDNFQYKKDSSGVIWIE
ncbi:FecR domain-containing protein [Chitinophagaceae bacterium LB-8]|uniref:FecR domain-containing protein n=1 Tax=Paraflavisolibacter caeni TaxID=2982496 RepID=A0A9X2XX21_9BACT|nr:FecR domain-containing protein [Paraflavisolibacter caeni]MCU7550112.1 FecR domain-containing protein [Paraflavisolibacter caeni]